MWVYSHLSVAGNSQVRWVSDGCRVMAMFASGVLCDSVGAGVEAFSGPMDTDADDSNLRAAFIDFLHSFSAGMEVPALP